MVQVEDSVRQRKEGIVRSIGRVGVAFLQWTPFKLDPEVLTILASGNPDPKDLSSDGKPEKVLRFGLRQRDCRKSRRSYGNCPTRPLPDGRVPDDPITAHRRDRQLIRRQLAGINGISVLFDEEGEGSVGMATIWRPEEQKLKAQIAAEWVPATSDDVVSRLRQEVRRDISVKAAKEVPASFTRFHPYCSGTERRACRRR